MSKFTESVSQKRKEQEEESHKRDSLEVFEHFTGSMKTLLDTLETTGAKKLDKEYIAAVKRLEDVYKGISSIKVTSDQDIKRALYSLALTLQNLDVKPTVNVTPSVTVEEREIDFKPIIDALNKLKPAKQAPVNIDMSRVEDAVNDVKAAISGLEFPVANYVLPFSKDGKATQVVLDSSGNVPVSGTVAISTTGLATEAKQDTGNTSLSSINSKVPSNLTVTSTRLLVDGSGVTQPVSGTVGVTGVSTAANQTNGSQLTQIVDAGGEAVTVTGGKLDVNATISGSSGGTSSIDDSAFTVGTDSGTPMMGIASSDTVDSGDVGVVAMDTARNLKVVNQANSGVDIGDVTINNASGGSAVNIQDGGNSITVDQGTAANLNMTEANSAAIKTAVETIDNIVSGSGINQTQVGGTNIDTNSGVKSAGTQRVVLATDQPQLTNALKVDGSAVTQPVSGTVTANLAAGTNNIGDVDVLTLPVAFNTGTRSATTQRVTIATDDVVPASQSGTWNIGTVTTLTGITNALPAGTNAIGKLAANSGVDIGDVDVTSAVTSTLDHGSNQDIDTAAEQITSTSFACKFGVTLRAPIDNTSTLWIGNSDVTVGGTASTDGIPLYPGDSLFLPVSNSNIPYAIASANNQKIYWVAA